MSPSTADAVEYVIQDKPDSQLRARVIKSLVEFNTHQASPEDHQPLGVFARRSGQVVGGAIGYTHWNWLYVSHLWVQDEDRGSEIGTQLLRQIEGAARHRGMDAVHLDTYDFQALPFYLRQGYEEFGRLNNYPNGHSRHFLWKRLALTADSDALNVPILNGGSVP